MKKPTSFLQSCSNSRGAWCLLLARSIGTHCCFGFALLLPQVRSFLLKENCLFHKPQASEFPYHEPSASTGRCSAFFYQLPSQDEIFWVAFVGCNHGPSVHRRILWDLLSLLPANHGENTFGNMDGYLSPTVPLFHGHQNIAASKTFQNKETPKHTQLIPAMLP